MRRFWPLAVVVVVVGLIGGCGGHNGQVPPGGGGVTTSFVGRAVCATCHAAIHAAYGSYLGVPFIPGTRDPSHVFANFVGSAHGQDMRSKGPNNINVLDGFGGSCRPCHTTGFAEPGGYVSAAATPHLEDISCEECHGPGSDHAGAPSSSNINRIPAAQTTCWDCHVPTYKLLRSGPPPLVTDATLRGTAPGSISPHYRQTPFLLGFEGYNHAPAPGPHSLVDNTCVTCHLNDASTTGFHGEGALAPDFEACAPCHGSAAAGQALFEALDEEINNLLIELGGEDPSNPGEPNSSPTGGLFAAFVAAHGIDLATNSNPDDPFVQAYKGARNNYFVVEGGKAVHNAPLARELLQQAKDLLSQ